MIESSLSQLNATTNACLDTSVHLLTEYLKVESDVNAFDSVSASGS